MSCNEDNDNDVSHATTSSGRKKKEYSVKFKLQVVEWAKLNRNSDGESLTRRERAGDHQTTAAGNPRPPQPETYLQRVLDAWEAVKEDVIIRSFKACGISTKLDGSEDALIHCLKEGNGMPDGVASLVQARQQAHAQDLSELMQGLEVEAPEDPEDDAGNDSDISVISAEDQAAEESEEFEEEEDSDSEF
ncbi:pogo transposable element with KRAB domain-like protein [Aphelenchoides avenae]|nr:pogo transposable element with KRAB domain-like protein [Aphelenchus avenae]